ncbi:MAG: helix-turn-helix domain-containing protein [Tenericutes bacterium]|nr:helix-turn-helix domain-containing protein [Mycoplasmatota bacterium]
MKDIGTKFQEKREEIGIKLEEAAKDLDITVAQLENLEDGNVNAFKDIFFLKELIKKYATYLNLDENEIMEDFNDFVFDFTSRIPVEEIEEKVKEIVSQNEKETRKKISSPYTRKKVRKAKMKPVYFFSVITVILVCVTFILLNIFLNKQREFNYIGSEIYEFTK